MDPRVFRTRAGEALAVTEATTSMDEVELVSRIRQGDAEACEQLVRAYRGRMLAVARRMLPCEDDCDDAVQDALMCAFQSIDNFKGHCGLSTWLHRIVVNACLMWLRSRSSRHTVSIEDLSPGFNEPASCERCTSRCFGDTSAAVEDQEVRSRVRTCIDHLPESYREVVLLRDIQEYDTDQTAQLLGATRSNVKTRLHRARRALRPLLAPVFLDASEPVRAA